MSFGRISRRAVFALIAVFSGALPLAAQTRAAVTVRLPRAVLADGQPLPAGTYSLRLSNDAVSPVVGQGPDASRWVEFVQSGQVKGRELASVIRGEDVKAVVKGTPPAVGSARVQLLRGADYLRVWANVDGTQYLIHLMVGAPK